MTTPEKEILFVCGSFWPVVGGGERHAEDVSTALAKRGWKVRIVTRKIDASWKSEDSRKGVRITRLGPSGHRRWNKYLLGRELTRYIRGNQANIALIYVAGFRILGFPVTKAALSLGLPVILRAEACGEMSGEYIWNSPHTKKERKWLKFVMNPLIQLRNRTLRKAQCFLAIADVIDKEYAHQNVAAEKRRIIPNGIDFNRFEKAEPGRKRHLRAELKLPPDAFLFCYAGKLNRGKGLEVLMEAFAALAEKCDHAHLLLVGSGGGMFLGCEDELRNTVRTLELEKRIHFTGYVDQVESYLQASDAFVFPSEMEAFGLAPIEAAACGLPLLSTTAGALAQTMREGITARTFPVGDQQALTLAMERTLNDKEESDRMADRAHREFRETYSMDAVVSQHADLFHSILSQTNRPG